MNRCPSRRNMKLKRLQSSMRLSLGRRPTSDSDVSASFHNNNNSIVRRSFMRRSSILSMRSSLSSIGDTPEDAEAATVDAATQDRAIKAAEDKKLSFHESLPTSLLQARERREARDVVARFDPSEVLLGPRLGSGEFSHVWEVSSFALQPLTEESTMSAKEEEERNHMKRYERYRETKTARYAVKHIKEDFYQNHSSKEYIQATSDLTIEAEFLASLQHPNIIKLRGVSSHGAAGFGEGPRGYFLVIDRLVETLDQRMRKWRRIDNMRNTRQRSTLSRSLSVFPIKPKSSSTSKKGGNDTMDERFNIALQISAALVYLHKHSVIFRDLKPVNIGFDVRGDVKIFDFGLARVVPDSGDPNNDVFEMSGAGSPRYMSPECLDHKPYNLKSDVYSFAIILWELLSGQTPYVFIRRKHQLINYVVKEHGRPDIDESWPASVKGMLESSFDADLAKRPKMTLWLEIIRETLIALRNGNRKGLGDSYITRRRTYDSMKDLFKGMDADTFRKELKQELNTSLDKSIHKYEISERYRLE